jgi:hypothetical protein
MYLTKKISERKPTELCKEKLKKALAIEIGRLNAKNGRPAATERVIQETAKEIGEKVTFAGFLYSGGWLHRCKLTSLITGSRITAAWKITRNGVDTRVVLRSNATAEARNSVGYILQPF